MHIDDNICYFMFLTDYCFLQILFYCKIQHLPTIENSRLKVESWTCCRPLYLLEFCKKLHEDAAQRYFCLSVTAFVFYFLFFFWSFLYHVFLSLQVEFKSVLSTSKDLQFSVEVRSDLYCYLCIAIFNNQVKLLLMVNFNCAILIILHDILVSFHWVETLPIINYLQVF